MKNIKSLKELVADHVDQYESTFEKDLAKLSDSKISEIKSMRDAVDSELEKINIGYDEGVEIENKFRKAGYLPSQARDLLAEFKNKEIGKVFKFFGKELNDVVNGRDIVYTAFDKYFVKTPFNTVVQADEYIDTLQNQLIAVAKLNEEFTSASFVGLIKLAFKRLFKRG